MSTIVSQHYPYGIGVDTHAATHTFAIVTSNSAHLDTQKFPTTTAGMQRAISWVGRRTDGDLDALWVIEGIGSYGAQLAQVAQHTGYALIEAPRMTNKSRRGLGKTDRIDAHRIATATLPVQTDQLRKPRLNDGINAALKTLLTSRDEIGRERTRAVNALTAVLRTTDLGVDARRALGKRNISAVSKWRHRDEPVAISTARAEATRLANHIHQADRELQDNDATMARFVADSPAAGLTNMTGIGPVSAARVLVAWGYPGRLRNEAAFAALAGASPIPASSGKTTRYRLNRGGDRQLNRALNVIAMHRMIHDPETQAYVEKRRAEGKTDREIRRTLNTFWHVASTDTSIRQQHDNKG